MDNRNEDKQMLQAFDIISTHFVDVLTNHTYTYAKSTQGKADFAEVYRNCMYAYLLGLRNDTPKYKQIVDTLFKFYETFYHGTSFTQFVDTIIHYMVPQDYVALMTLQQKDEMLHLVIGDLVAELIAYITSPEFRMNARETQDRGIKILQTKRIELHNKFMKSQTGATGMLAGTTLDKMKLMLKRLARQKVEQQAIAGRLREQCKHLEHELTQLRAREKKLLKYIKLLRAPNKPAALIDLKKTPRDSIGEVVEDPFDTTPPPPERIAEVTEPRRATAGTTETKKATVPTGVSPIEKEMTMSAAINDAEDEGDGDEGDEAEDEGDDEGGELTL